MGAEPRPDHWIVGDAQRVQAEVAEGVVDAGDQLLSGVGRLPRPIRRTATAELGDDHQIFRVWMQSLPDDLIGDVRAVVVGGADMVDAGRNGLAEDADGSVRIPGRSPYTRAGKLHRAVAHPVDRQ